MPTTISSHITSEPLNAHATTMKAIVQDQYGSADVLRLQEVPEAGGRRRRRAPTRSRGWCPHR
jgi:hypothetical protein